MRHGGIHMFDRRFAAAGAALVLLAIAAAAALAKHEAPPQKPAAPAQTEPMWDLTDLYPSPDAWTAEHDKIKAEAAKIDSLKGTLGKSAKDMLAGLSEMSHVRKEAARLATYASL